MTKYIDKAEVVEEIKKRIKENEEHWKTHGGIETATGRGVSMGYRDILYFIDTLETKEVDLETAIDKWICDDAITHEDCSITDVISTAKHFFELGLKTQGE